MKMSRKENYSFLFEDIMLVNDCLKCSSAKLPLSADNDGDWKARVGHLK